MKCWGFQDGQDATTAVGQMGRVFESGVYISRKNSPSPSLSPLPFLLLLLLYYGVL